MSDSGAPPPPPPPPGYGPPPPPPPPPGQGPPPPGYGPAPGYGPGPATPPNSGKAVAVLVLGILSLPLTCGYGLGFITAVVALALAPGAKREINASAGQLGGLGFVKAGVICSWIAIGLVALGVVAIIALVVLSVSLDSTVTYNAALSGAVDAGRALGGLLRS